MCSVRMAARACALAAALPWTAARAQDTRAYEQRVDQFARDHELAQKALAARRDSLRVTGHVFDTLVVGPLRILTDAQTVDIARVAAERVVATLTRSYGFALSGIGQYPLVAHRVGSARSEMGDRRNYSDWITIGVIGKGGAGNDVADVEPKPEIVYNTMLTAAFMALGNVTDPALIHWLGQQPPLDGTDPEMWTSARIGMLSSHSATGRRCYTGDLDACKIALALVPVTDTVLQWFDSTDRRRLIKRNEENPWSRPNYDVTHACLEGTDSACVTILRQYPQLRLGPPMQRRHRVTLVRMATTLGGDGAVERLVSTNGSPAERVAAAARLPIDSVLKLWLLEAKRTEVASDDMSVGIAASSLVWVLACVALALRSSRWR